MRIESKIILIIFTIIILVCLLYKKENFSVPTGAVPVSGDTPINQLEMGGTAIADNDPNRRITVQAVKKLGDTNGPKIYLIKDGNYIKMVTNDNKQGRYYTKPGSNDTTIADLEADLSSPNIDIIPISKWNSYVNYNNSYLVFLKTSIPTPISLVDLSPLSSLDITLNNLSTFANGINLLDPNKVTPTQLTDLKQSLLNEVKSLSTSLNSINDQMKLQQNKDTLNKPTNQEDSIDLKTTQLLQNKEIAKLTNRLNTLKTLYQNYSQEKAVNEYPKIPIYSSCIVAEASGGYSLDNLNKKPTSEKPIVYANQAVVPGTQTYNPNKNVDINNPILTLEDILHQLSKNDINVNFNI